MILKKTAGDKELHPTARKTVAAKVYNYKSVFNVLTGRMLVSLSDTLHGLLQ